MTFPGALTRVSTEESPYTANELGGGSKDTWVQAPPDFEEPPPDRARLREALLPSQHVSSRVAEAFYWTGRYLERAHNLAVMIGVIESLELEELNPTERTLYRPVWNRILPPLENPGFGLPAQYLEPGRSIPADPRSGGAGLRRAGHPARRGEFRVDPGVPEPGGLERS